MEKGFGLGNSPRGFFVRAGGSYEACGFGPAVGAREPGKEAGDEQFVDSNQKGGLRESGRPRADGTVVAGGTYLRGRRAEREVASVGRVGDTYPRGGCYSGFGRNKRKNNGVWVLI
uniref:Uncharacterized protein n=1 Tax=Knipowitschia caucasica TaxID=637954 RepID=A0AAV2J5E9_KNICA